MSSSRSHFRGTHHDFTGKLGNLGDDLAYSEHAYLTDLAHKTLVTTTDNSADPKTLAEAQSGTDWPKWKEAMDREIETLTEANTWTLVDRLPCANIVSSKWVFCIKRYANGTVEKYKAHLVVCGFSQIYGVDYLDTYSPIA